jgi:hypothetical protein
MNYKQEIQSILSKNPLPATDMQKLTTLVSLMSEGEGEEGYDETMYGYLVGIHDWRRDYKEFVA